MKNESPADRPLPENPPTVPVNEELIAAEPPPLDERDKKIAELRDQLLRARADFDNYRKRVAREKDEAVKYANADLLATLLPVIDNFELGLQAAAGAADPQAVVTGMAMVKAQLRRFLDEQGVTEIDDVGKKFNPHLHDAVTRQESDEHEEDIIISRQRKGYKLKDRLLRPATVVVATRENK